MIENWLFRCILHKISFNLWGYHCNIFKFYVSVASLHLRLKFWLPCQRNIKFDKNLLYETFRVSRIVGTTNNKKFLPPQNDVAKVNEEYYLTIVNFVQTSNLINHV